MIKSLLVGIVASLMQCAPPAPDWSGVGSCYTRESPDNDISGYAACSSAQANGYTQFRSDCTYTVYVPLQGSSFRIITSGVWKNPPNNDPAYPEASRELSWCEVPSMLYLPAYSYPVLDNVSFVLG